MATLRELYDQYIKDRLAWMTIRRDREEALFKAIVERIEALEGKNEREDYEAEILSGAQPALPKEFTDKILAETVAEHSKKRGPGRPPKVDEAA